MGLRDTFKTDPKLETEGKRFVIGINEGEKEGSPNYEQFVILARMGKSNKDYLKAIEVKSSPHRAAIEHGTMPEKLSSRIMREVLAETVVKGWGGLPRSEWTGDEKDAKIYVPFSPEEALALFTELPGVYDDWSDKAKAASNYRAEQLKVEAKN